MLEKSECLHYQKNFEINRLEIRCVWRQDFLSRRRVVLRIRSTGCPVNAALKWGCFKVRTTTRRFRSSALYGFPSLSFKVTMFVQTHVLSTVLHNFCKDTALFIEYFTSRLVVFFQFIFCPLQMIRQICEYFIFDEN